MPIKQPNKLLTICLLPILIFACKKEEKTDPVKVWPTIYEATNFSTNSAAESKMTSQLSQVVNAISMAASNQKPLRYDSLLGLYQTLPNSPASSNTVYFNSIITGNNGVLQRTDWGSRQLIFPRFPSDSGAVYGKYIFDGAGLDLGEMVEKTGFGSILFNNIISISKGELNPNKVDQMVALFGSNPDFPNTPTLGKATNPDNFIAKYAARRDKNDGLGLYTQIKSSFITLKEASRFGHTYHSEMEKALSTLKISIEKVFAGSVINYCGSVESQISATDFTLAKKSGALHSLTEGIGFLFGLKAIPATDRKISDAQIDEILGFLHFQPNGNSSPYLFIDNPLGSVDRLSQAKSRIQAIYGFSETEMADFSKNWVNEQGR